MGALPTAEEWAARVAAACDGIADLTQDPRFRRAAGVLRGKRIGRRAHDDAQALDLARSLLAAGLVRSRTAALRRAATFTAPDCIETTVRRLRRKFRDEKLPALDSD
jgi:hypothetical protein